MIHTEQKYIQKLSIQSLYWCWKDVLCRTRINVLWCFVDVFSTFTIDVQMKFLHYNFRRPQLQTTEDVWREPGVVQIKGLLHAAKATGRIWTSIVLCRWHYLCRKMILQLLILFLQDPTHAMKTRVHVFLPLLHFVFISVVCHPSRRLSDFEGKSV